MIATMIPLKLCTTRTPYHVPEQHMSVICEEYETDSGYKIQRRCTMCKSPQGMLYIYSKCMHLMAMANPFAWAYIAPTK